MDKIIKGLLDQVVKVIPVQDLILYSHWTHHSPRYYELLDVTS
jgi:hypothetical protein